MKNKGDILELDFPAAEPIPCEIPDGLAEALGAVPFECYRGTDILAVFENENTIRQMTPDFRSLKNIDSRGIIVTAKGDSCDFVSRFFAPAIGIDEDPVTGSAHCVLTPYWAKKLNKKLMVARQVSKRGGMLFCTPDDDRVLIAGKCSLFMKGTITV